MTKWIYLYAINVMFILGLLGCNGAEFSGNRGSGKEQAPPIVVEDQWDDDQDKDPDTDTDTDPDLDKDPKPCTDKDDENCLPDPCDEDTWSDDYTPAKDECFLPCDEIDCDDPYNPDDPGQSDDPSQSDDASQRRY